MTKIIIILVVLGAFGGGAYFFSTRETVPGRLDDFARCLSDKGAIFYGAFWCPHCQNQKAMFGSSAKFLNYVECSTADSRGQLQVCKEKDIKGYPTWVFADESRLSGEISLADLAKKTGCSFPN